MPDAGAEERVLGALANGSDEPLYAVLDGARDPRIVPWLISTRAPAWCLYAGKLPSVLEESAPWLLRLGRWHAYTRELFEMGWGRAWGFFLACRGPGRAVRRHLRKNLLVSTEEGRRLVFRFYDPRILSAYLPSCTVEETRQFLGPISAVCAERDGQGELVVRHPDERVQPAQLIGSRPSIPW